jgi:hypothetical protein
MDLLNVKLSVAGYWRLRISHEKLATLPVYLQPDFVHEAYSQQNFDGGWSRKIVDDRGKSFNSNRSSLTFRKIILGASIAPDAVINLPLRRALSASNFKKSAIPRGITVNAAPVSMRASVAKDESFPQSSTFTVNFSVLDFHRTTKKRKPYSFSSGFGE